jgi:hypothetical protein
VTRRGLLALVTLPDGDPERLTGLIELEERAALAYRVAGSPLAQQEAEHAAALRTELAGFTIRAPARPRRAERLTGAAAAVAGGDRGAVVALEQELVAVYLREVPLLVEDGVVRTAATILASHSQHLALARAGDLAPPR